ncbi:MAG: hypothetical protein KKB51_21080, partial [Candidatus Riflebacteria bacterium]|nr:hypothetical protein [Candidatus Riflebacteria bacterium]
MVWGWSNYNNPATSGIADGELIQLAIGDGNAPPTLFDFFNSQQDLWGFWLEWQADMVVFDTFQASINQRLDAAGIKVRVDRVDDVMAFTSTRVGTEHVNGAAPIESRIDFSIVGSNIFQTRVTQQFGFAL